MRKTGTKYKGYLVLVLVFSIGLLAACSSETKDTSESEMPKVISERKVTVDGKEGTEKILDDGSVVQMFDDEELEKSED
ncbi:hypothetical protein IGK38_003052 [Enterococcus pernyi]